MATAATMLASEVGISPDLYPSEDDLVYEEEILRNPFSLKLWWRYLVARTNAPIKKRSVIYEHVLKALLGSYKLWHVYLCEHLAATDHSLHLDIVSPSSMASLPSPTPDPWCSRNCQTICYLSSRGPIPFSAAPIALLAAALPPHSDPQVFYRPTIGGGQAF